MEALNFVIFILSIVFWIIFPIIFMGVFIYYIHSARKRGKNTKTVTLSTLRDIFIILSAISLGNVLLVINAAIGAPLSPQGAFLPAMVLTILAAYRIQNYLVLTFGVIGTMYMLTILILNKLSMLGANALIKALSISLPALLLYAIGVAHRNTLYHKFSLPYIVMGSIIILSITWSLSFKSSYFRWLNPLIESGGNTIFMTLALLIITLGIIIYIAREKFHRGEMLVLLSTTAAFVGVVLMLLLNELVTNVIYTQNVSAVVFHFWLALFALFDRYDTTILFFWITLFNLLLFAQLVMLILIGYLRQSQRTINLGLVLLFITIMIKYFNLMFTFMQKGIFMISAGILLLLLGYIMERTRRRLQTMISASH